MVDGNNETQEEIDDHDKKMAVRKYYGGIFVFLVCGAVEIFIKPVPPYLYMLAVVVAGIEVDVTKIFNRK